MFTVTILIGCYCQMLRTIMFENSAKSTVLYRELKYTHIIKDKMLLNHKSSIGNTQNIFA